MRILLNHDDTDTSYYRFTDTAAARDGGGGDDISPPNNSTRNEPQHSNGITYDVSPARTGTFAAKLSTRGGRIESTRSASPRLNE